MPAYVPPPLPPTPAQKTLTHLSTPYNVGVSMLRVSSQQVGGWIELIFCDLLHIFS